MLKRSKQLAFWLELTQKEFPGICRFLISPVTAFTLFFIFIFFIEWLFFVAWCSPSSIAGQSTKMEGTA